MFAGNIQLNGHHVLVAGSARAARRAVARYKAAGAHVLEAHEPRCAERLLNAAHRIRLVVAIDDGNPGWSVPEELAESQTILVSREPAAQGEGSVTLLGGGPGSSDLLTVRGVDALAAADVVFYDRLGPSHELALLAPGAALVDVGKAPGHHKVPQARIAELMIESARAGNNVVRLKGGDPYVFGRGSEELADCRTAGIQATVIPGISSAISVPGAVGIPVTARGISKGFTVLSGHDPFTEQELGHMAGFGGTLVVLMGVATLEQTTAGLLRHGLDAGTPAAIIERGCTDTQRSTRATLGTLAAAARSARCSNPAVIVIGGVAALGDQDLALQSMMPAVAR